MLSYNVRKKIKSQVELSDREEDRLSNLPEMIITRILSFLSTKDYVRTSILSTRWKYLWSSVPTLNLSLCDFVSCNYYDLLNIVDRLVTGHTQHFLDNFIIDIDAADFPYDDGCHIETWIRAAIKRNVCELHIRSFSLYQPHELHQSLFSCNVLVVLKFQNTDIILNFPMTSTCFPNLILLELDFIIFKNDSSAQNLISSCPVLEKLLISRSSDVYDNLRNLNVTSLSLKWFGLSYCTSAKTTRVRVVLDAPSLETLDICDDFPVHEYVVRDLSSIISAKINIVHNYGRAQVGYGTRLHELLFKKIFNVKFLQLSEDAMFYLSLVKPCSMPSFYNLTCLDLEFSEVGNWCLQLKLVIEFLKSSPMLEVLNFQGFYSFGEEQGTSLEWDVVPNCLVSHLKTIKIEGSFQEEDVEFLGYFLKNAKVLEKMIVETNFGSPCFKNLMIIGEDLSKRPTGSITWSDRELAISFV